jgi:hypothetical protein
VWPSGSTYTGEWSFSDFAKKDKSLWKSIHCIKGIDFYCTGANKKFDIVSEILRERADRLNSRYFLVAMRMRQEKAYIESREAKKRSSEQEQQMAV